MSVHITFFFIVLCSPGNVGRAEGGREQANWRKLGSVVDRWMVCV